MEDVNLYSSISIGNFTTIKKMLQDDVKELKLRQQFISMCLSDSDISVLLKIDLALVSHRVTMLVSLNFSFYYHNFYILSKNVLIIVYHQTRI